MLKNEVICVRLYQSMWSARKTDKAVSTDTKHRYDAAEDAGSFNKKLAPASFLSGVNAAFAELDRFHKTRTVMWDDDGWRLLANADYFEYMAGMDERKADISRAVDMLQAGWSEFIENEEMRLGKMFDSTDYPTAHDLPEKYGTKIRRKILTTEDDIRIADHDAIEASLREEIMAEHADNQQRAMKDLWDRLYEPVKKLAEKLQDPDLKAQKSLVENVWNVTQLLSKLNVFGDRALEAMYKEIEDKLCKHSVKKLKIDEDAYAETKAAVEDIMKRMEGYI